MKLLIINGPNINLIGVREPEFYGNDSYQTLLDRVRTVCGEEGIDVEFYQSNHEGALVDRIQEAYFERVDGIVINPAAYTHTSVALLDAVKAVKIPTVEVHLSKVNEREDFRQISYIRLGCVKSITGLGIEGYISAVRFLKGFCSSQQKERIAI